MSDTKISEARNLLAEAFGCDPEELLGGEVRAVRAVLALQSVRPQPAELAEQQGVDTTDALALVYEEILSIRNTQEYARSEGNDHLADQYDEIHLPRWQNLRNALAATGKQQVGEDCTAILAARIALEVELCGSLQRVAKELSIDVGYLSRLERGEKTNPSDEVLEKLGLERTVTYTPIKREYVASPLHPRTKSA